MKQNDESGSSWDSISASPTLPRSRVPSFQFQLHVKWKSWPILTVAKQHEWIMIMLRHNLNSFLVNWTNLLWSNVEFLGHSLMQRETNALRFCTDRHYTSKQMRSLGPGFTFHCITPLGLDKRCQDIRSAWWGRAWSFMHSPPAISKQTNLNQVLEQGMNDDMLNRATLTTYQKQLVQAKWHICNSIIHINGIYILRETLWLCLSWSMEHLSNCNWMTELCL